MKCLLTLQTLNQRYSECLERSLADSQSPRSKSSRVEKNDNRANAFYRRAVDLDIE